jgi:hypothetical protein
MLKQTSQAQQAAAVHLHFLFKKLQIIQRLISPREVTV